MIIGTLDGCFYKLGVLSLGVLVTRALAFWGSYSGPCFLDVYIYDLTISEGDPMFPRAWAHNWESLEAHHINNKGQNTDPVKASEGLY